MHFDEMHGDVDVVSDEIGESMRCGLIGDTEGISQVLDREVPTSLAALEKFDGVGLGDQHGGGKVVHLDPLSKEVRIVQWWAVS
jgi:hypothetical protein